MLAFSMDESTDRKQEKLYVVAGFLGRPGEIWEAERHWSKRVRKEGIEYFRTNEYNTLTGEFAKLVCQSGREAARTRADELLEELWLIVKSVNIAGFCFLGPIPAYETVRAEPYSEYIYEKDPYIQVHQHLIYSVAYHVCENFKALGPVAFAFDEHCKSASLLSRWEDQKARSPIASQCMGTLAPLDDRKSPAIQMADLLANTAKRVFENQMHNPKAGVEALNRICGQSLEWLAAWNEDYLRELREVV